MVGLVALLAAACSGSSSAGSAPPTAQPDGLRYVALGDSYTIGTGVTEGERWPNQLVALLADASPRLELVANLGVNGYTSVDVIREELPQLRGLSPDYVTLLIGVNDVVQGVDPADYRSNVGRILDRLLEQLPAQRILAVGTPDYTLTPYGDAFGDPAQQRAAIQEANRILTDEAASRAIRFVDVYDLSQRVADDPALVAGDGLHPSGAQYRLWAERLAPVVRELLREG